MNDVTIRRTLCLAVMGFLGTLMALAFDWVTSIPYDQITGAHSALIGCVYSPVVMGFKFAFDMFDGKKDA